MVMTGGWFVIVLPTVYLTYGYFDMFIYVLIPVPGREDDNRIQWIWE